MDGTKLLHWFLGRMWDEENRGKLIAISVALTAGLIAVLHFGDWDSFSIWSALILGCVVVIIVFPVATIVATALHASWKQSRGRRRSRDKMKKLFENLGGEEEAAIQQCVFRGTSVIRLVEINNSQDLTYEGFESLINRDLAQLTSTALGVKDAYALDTELFNYAQTALPKLPF